MGAYTGTKPAQFRFPEWANLFVEERAAATGSSRTDVVLEALECLRQREVEGLMAEGYLARAAESADLAEQGLRAAEKSLPEW
jgi:BioD-like phosphotransacetylase family protein